MPETVLLNGERDNPSVHIEELFYESNHPFVGLQAIPPVQVKQESLSDDIVPSPPAPSQSPPVETQERMQLVLDHFDLVGLIVRKFVCNGASRSPNDLESDAQLGLMDAANRFDPSHPGGASFRTYAFQRIASAILDGNREYFGKNNEKPTSLLRTHVSLDVSVGEDDGTLRLIDAFPHEAPGPEELVVDESSYTLLHRAIAILPERDKKIVMAYYFEEQSMKTIGDIWGISESRVSQIVARSRNRLRDSLQGSLIAE
jgi:RNA polymerase sigma factor for flagellar operon FliA